MERANWLLSPAEVRSCVAARRFVVVGDSLGHNIWVGLSCFLQGYSGIAEADFTLQMVGRQPETLPLFASRGTPWIASYQDFLEIINFSPNRATGTDFIYQVGMWPISFTASTEWARGFHRLLGFIKQFQAAEGAGSRHWIGQATAVHSDVLDSGGRGPLWQTASRTALYNRILRDVVSQYGHVRMLDNFGPTLSRFDGRLDNCHICESVAIELAAHTMKGICQASN